MPCVWPVTDDIMIPPHPPLAIDEVRYVGDAVAVVIAGDRYQAADALEAIEVDYEPLPPVLDMRAALADGPTSVHDRPRHEQVATRGSSAAATTRPRRPRRTGSSPATTSTSG